MEASFAFLRALCVSAVMCLHEHLANVRHWQIQSAPGARMIYYRIRCSFMEDRKCVPYV